MIPMNEAAYHQHTAGSQPVLVEFWAPWCVYCRRITPALTKVASQYKGQVTVGTVNIDDEPGLAKLERIEVVPTLVLYQGGQALGSIVAPESKAAIDAFIQENL